MLPINLHATYLLEFAVILLSYAFLIIGFDSMSLFDFAKKILLNLYGSFNPVLQTLGLQILNCLCLFLTQLLYLLIILIMLFETTLP
jgi:hypothetical protein